MRSVYGFLVWYAAPLVVLGYWLHIFFLDASLEAIFTPPLHLPSNLLVGSIFVALLAMVLTWSTMRRAIDLRFGLAKAFPRGGLRRRCGADLAAVVLAILAVFTAPHWHHVWCGEFQHDLLCVADLARAEISQPKPQGLPYTIGAELQGAHLRRADLHGAFLEEADLRGADLRGANLTGAWLRGADLQDAKLDGAHLQGAHLDNAVLSHAQAKGAWFSHAQLTGASLQEAHLEGAHLGGAVLQRADLQFAHLRGADLTYAQAQGALLSQADCADARLDNASLLGANLTAVVLRRATVLGTDFRGAALEDAEIGASDLQDGYIDGADLTGVSGDLSSLGVERDCARREDDPKAGKLARFCAGRTGPCAKQSALQMCDNLRWLALRAIGTHDPIARDLLDHPPGWMWLAPTVGPHWTYLGGLYRQLRAITISRAALQMVNLGTAHLVPDRMGLPVRRVADTHLDGPPEQHPYMLPLPRRY